MQSTTCDYCKLQAPSEKVFAGIFIACLGPQDKWKAAISHMRKEIPRLRAEAKSDWKHREGILSCSAEYQQHLTAMELAMANAKNSPGAYLFDLRRQRGLTQKEVSTLLCVSQQAVSQVEKSERPCPQEWLSRLSNTSKKGQDVSEAA